MYGCGMLSPSRLWGATLTVAEHLQRLFNQDQATTNTSIQHYKAILRSIYDTTPLLSQTAKSTDGQIVTSLTPTYLCLQCPSTLTEDDRTKHGTKKSHRFCMLALEAPG
jgi:ubiquitin carboxyl-terminal hydrolase 22/27/51